MSKGFFGRLARRPVREEVDEHENRLTEVLAAVLGSEACRGLALFLVRGWLREAEEQLPERVFFRRLHERVDDGLAVFVRTELPIVAESGNRRVDLELKLVPEGGRPLRLWVEAKHGTSPRPRQLRDYRDALKARDGDGVVLLVAPRQDLATFKEWEIPPDVPQLSWQDTARILKRYTPSSSIERFLVDELCSYLREEGLMDPERVTPEHLIAFAHHYEASQALARVCEIAGDRVRAGWGEPTGVPAERQREKTWSYNWRAEAPRPNGCIPRWILFTDASTLIFHERPGASRFTAGIGASGGHIASIDPEARERLVAHGFQVLGSRDLPGINYENVWKVAFPEEILAGSDLKAQGEALADWILGMFEELAALLTQQ